MALPQQGNTMMTEAEYLVFDAENDFKSEFADGQVIVMAGASHRHGLIVTNIIGNLYSKLADGTCRILPESQRIKIQKKNKKNVYRYPDVVVVCADPQFAEDTQEDTLTNPTALFEVLSPSTASVDRVQKLDEYQQMISVQDHLIVAQSEASVIHYQRQTAKTWLNTRYTTLDETIALPSLDCMLKLSEIYNRIAFDSDDT